MAAKVDLEVLGVIENMSAFTGPDGERVAIFGEGGGQMLADELDVPLLAKVPLSSELREHADEGKPLVIEDPDAPASQMIREAARGIVAATPVELPLLQGAEAATPAAAPNGGGISGTELPMVQ
jgi:ATP-binding protein involved in chromosome partitioning